MIAVAGIGSSIAAHLQGALRFEDFVGFRLEDDPPVASRYLFCSGFLVGKRLTEQKSNETAATFYVNFEGVARACDRIFERQDDARVCVIGSESGFSGSFDAAYAASKAALHHYVETKRLRTPHQQLVGIAPSIIVDAGMTERRSDLDRLEERRKAHPKQRFLTSEEVANLVRHVLYSDNGYLSGTVIRMHGGERR